MNQREEKKEVYCYSYMRDGILYHTSNEQIAMLRSDTGVYNVEYLSAEPEQINLKDSK
jgi:hypothetical protein